MYIYIYSAFRLYILYQWNRTHNLCAANAMLYHWATGAHNVLLSIATNIAVLLMTASVLQGHISAKPYSNYQPVFNFIKHFLLNTMLYVTHKTPTEINIMVFAFEIFWMQCFILQEMRGVLCSIVGFVCKVKKKKTLLNIKKSKFYPTYKMYL